MSLQSKTDPLAPFELNSIALCRTYEGVLQMLVADMARLLRERNVLCALLLEVEHSTTVTKIESVLRLARERIHTLQNGGLTR